MNKKIFVLIAVIVALVLSRLLLLNTLPATLTHDELVYATQAYSYTVQGKTLDHKQTPLSITPNDPMYAELPATVLVPGFYLSKNVLVASHIVPALLGILFPIAIGWLLFGLWKDKLIAISAVILTTFNPLLWQFSRMSYDAYFSTVFYIFGAALLVNLKNWWKLFSLPLFFFGFFQYQGFKIILIPFVLGILLLQHTDIKEYVEKKLYTKNVPEILIICVLFLLTMFYGFILLPGQNVNNRLSRTIFSDSAYLKEQVDRERKLSISSPFLTLSSNKITTAVDFMVTRTVQTFNPTLLFQIIPPANHGYTLWTHGLFYLFEGICIVLGIGMQFVNPKTRIRGALLLLGVFFLNITNMINTDSGWSLLRGFMSYVLLLIIGSFGFAYILRLKNKIIMTGLLLLYVVNIISFGYQYMYRYPVMSLDLGNFDERVIARYISLHEEKNPEIPIAVYTEEPWYYLYSYLLYSQALTKDNTSIIANQLQKYRLEDKQVYRIGNISFANTCVPQNKTGVYIANKKQDTCINDKDNTEIKLYGTRDFTTTKKSAVVNTIASIQDSGVKYLIHNDFICEGMQLKNYLHLNSHDQLAIEHLSQRKFCEEWITNIKNY